MNDWIKKVIRPWVQSKNGRTTNVILDEFIAHLTASKRDALDSIGCHLVTIAGGYTCRLRVMDVGLDKPFKDFLRNEYDHWQENNDCIMGTTTPQQSDVALWIKNSFGKRRPQMRRKVGVPQLHNNDDDDDDNKTMMRTMTMLKRLKT
jgi:hypothetical protein